MSDLGIEAGLLVRLRAAGGSIAWTDGPPARGGRGRPRARLARLREEKARVELLERPGAVTVEVTSGPVGALVLLLEADRRGPPTSLGSRNAGTNPAFPDGSIVGAWGGGVPPADARPTVRDLIDLARYALL